MNAKKLGGALFLSGVLLAGAIAVAADPPHPGRGGRSGRERPVVAAAMQAAADQTGLDMAELVTGLRDGSTLAGLVTEAGGDVQAVIDAAVAAGQTQIDAALTNGRISEEQATALSQNLVEGVTAAVNGEAGWRWSGRVALRVAGARELVRAVAEATGLTPREVAERWRNGVSLNDVAAANGASPEAISAAVMADVTERISEAVANGRMTQTEADLALQSLAERIADAMSRVHERPAAVEGSVGL
ncbi:MAG: hypothetical protein JNL34_01200 [Anaerolineae bacterium]|nr:hypothetical protein [Anaerolineae bacterium]